MSIRITSLIGSATMIAAAVVGGGTANATSQDDQFLQLLQQDGLTVLKPDNMIQAAHDFCDGLAQGATGKQVIQALVTQDQYTQEQATDILNASVTAYCPNEHSAAAS